MLILTALSRDAGFGGAPSDWYAVSEAGFNYVDDQCHAYFDNLFFLDRGREQIKSGLTAAGQTTAAILAVTGAAAPSLAIAAQAFGFAASATDLAAGTYLYRLPPATTQGFVEKLQLAFRDAALANRAQINSPTSAYYMIQRYLNLCLPPTIEAEITKQIAATSAFGVPTTNGHLFSIETVSATPATRALGIPIVKTATAPLAPVVTAPLSNDADRFGRTERTLSRSTIKCFQTKANVEPADGDLGGIASKKRDDLLRFLDAQPSPRTTQAKQLELHDIDVLARLGCV